MAAIPNQTLPGPQNPPSVLVLTAVSGTEIDLTWTNGDTSLDTVTEIWRGPSSGTETLLTTLGSGVASFQDTGLTSATTYFYKIRHVRNAQNSAYSTEQSTRTFCAQPTSVAAASIATGVRITYTNNQAGADIQIERSTNGTNFTLQLTVTNPGTGTFTADDTSGTSGITYYYRVKAVKGGETDSLYSTPIVSANFGLTPPQITAVSHSVNLTGQCPSDNNTTVTWTANHVTANDTAKVYSSVAGGAFSLFATVPLSQGSVGYTFSFRTGTPNHDVTLQFKVEAWDEGTTLSSSFTDTLSHNTVSTVVC
jgi:hypothetical protein